MAKILVVDDDLFTLKLIRLTFEREGHQVFTFQDPREVIPFVTNKHVDLVVLDVVMPHMSGWDLLSAIRDQPITHSLPVLMLSGLRDVPNKVRGLRAGANDYLGKPYDPAELLARAESLVDQKEEDLRNLQGHLEAYALTEVLQILQQNMKTGLLQVVEGDLSGGFIMEKGEPIGAALSNLTGYEAACALLEMKTGFFRFTPTEHVEVYKSAASLKLPALMMEVAWAEDELRARMAHVPGENESLTVGDNLETIPDVFKGLPITQVYRTVVDRKSVHFETLFELLPISPNRLRLCAAWLVEQGNLKRNKS